MDEMDDMDGMDRMDGCSRSTDPALLKIFFLQGSLVSRASRGLARDKTVRTHVFPLNHARS